MSDIRRFMTSPRSHGQPSPQASALPDIRRRNRIIHDTDSSSGEEIPYVRQRVQEPSPVGPRHDADQERAVIVATTDDEDDDDEIFIIPRRAQTPHQAVVEPREQPQPVQPVRPRRTTRRSPEHRAPPSRNRSRFAEEAEESDRETDHNSADESNEDAAALYRSAMLGVRNRPNAMHQVRAGTTPCPACRHFARFLQFF